MGWMETCAVDERMRFVMAAEKHEESFAALCRGFGVSRRVGYKWLARYREAGVAGLLDRSRAPLHHPHAIEDDVAERCLAVRREHPTWGPLKVRAWLERKPPAREWPAASTIGALFDREGLTVKRKLRRQSAVERPVRRVRGRQGRVVHRLQGLVLDRRRQALRAADADRRLQPLSAALSGAGAHRHRSCLAGAGCGVPRVRP